MRHFSLPPIWLPLGPTICQACHPVHHFMDGRSCMIPFQLAQFPRLGYPDNITTLRECCDIVWVPQARKLCKLEGDHT